MFIIKKLKKKSVFHNYWNIQYNEYDIRYNNKYNISGNIHNYKKR